MFQPLSCTNIPCNNRICVKEIKILYIYIYIYIWRLANVSKMGKYFLLPLNPEVEL